MKRRCMVSGALFVFLFITTSANGRRGIVGTKAPEVWASEWRNLPAGEERFSVIQNRGKVIYLFFFQSWCPGCHSRGFPTLNQVIGAFKNNKDVVFATIQTVFEGMAVNSPSKAVSTAKEFGLSIPIGHDSGRSGQRSLTMNRYRSGGTPWVVIIDRSGHVRFDGFHIKPKRAINLVKSLLEAPAISLP